MLSRSCQILPTPVQRLSPHYCESCQCGGSVRHPGATRAGSLGDLRRQSVGDIDGDAEGRYSGESLPDMDGGRQTGASSSDMDAGRQSGASLTEIDDGRQPHRPPMAFPGFTVLSRPSQEDSEDEEEEEQMNGQAAAASVSYPGLQVLSAPQANSEEETEAEDDQMRVAPFASSGGVQAEDCQVSRDAQDEEEEQSEDDAPLRASARPEPEQDMPMKELEEEGEEEEEPEENEEDAEMHHEAAAHVQGQPQQQGDEDEEQDEEDEEDEEDEDTGEVPSGNAEVAHAHAHQQLHAENDECEEEEEEEEDSAGHAEEEPLADMMSADVGAQLAALPSDSVPQSQLVPADRADPWASQRPEVNGQWTVTSDTCSLNVAGSVMKLPRSIFDRLYGYQRQGVAWMWNLYQKEFGGILADDMGLGKTVQVAAFLACLKSTACGSHFLLVVPVTLIENWRRELETWAGETGLAVHVLHGTPQERRSALRAVVTKGGVLVTSYDMVRTQIKLIRSASLGSVAAMPKKRKKTTKRGCRDDDSPSEEEFEITPEAAAEDRPWDVVVIDEGHQIKNPACVAGKELRRVRSRSRFLLTGTPLQNQLIDIWSLMDFAQPGLLGNHATFERNFSEQIARGSKKNATSFQIELKNHLAQELKRLTAPHFLRRMKDEVVMESKSKQAKTSRVAHPGPTPTAETAAGPAPEELPPKTDVVLWINLTQAQLELYDMYLASELVRKATGQAKCGMEALRAIALLKKLCSHPLLCLPRSDFDDWYRRVVQSGGGAPAAKLPRTAAATSAGSHLQQDQAQGFDDSQGDDMQPAPECQHVMSRLHALVPGSVEGATLLSSKLRVLSVLLPQLQRRGHRCLIFSQSTLMLDLVQACVLRVLGLKFLRVDGTIDPKVRDLKLSKFHQEGSRYFCMCLSTQVGGVGLTITGADRVILVDPAWNPAMDAQAIDRVHRIGQQQEVVVYRLIGAGSIEDKMFRLQVFKKGLAKTALEHAQQLRFFSHKELKQLFEAPASSSSTQSLMAEQLGTEALEHEALLRVVAGDVGGTDDPQALAFWQSSDVLGFSDYDKLFLYLEQATRVEADDEDKAEDKARALTESLRSEAYVKDQVLDGKWAPAAWRDGQSKENVSPQAPIPIQNC